MAGSQASARQSGQGVEAKERDAMCNVAQGLLTGIDDLLQGRVYQGTVKEDGALNEKPRKLLGRSGGGRRMSSPRSVRRSLRAKLDLKLKDKKEKKDVRSDGSPRSSNEASRDSAESSWDDDSDDFLFYNEQEIADAAEDDDDQARMERAQMAQRRIMLLLRRLNIEERVDLVDEVCTWFKERYAGAVTSIDHLTFQENFREQMLGKANDNMNELQEAVTKKEMDVLVKLNEFVARLKGTADDRREQEAIEAERRDQKTQEEMQRRMKLLEKLSREDLLLKKYLDIKDQTEKAKHELEIVMRQLEVEEAKLTSQLTRATKASDLLELIARQQEEITALNAMAALTTQRTTTLQSCIASTRTKKGKKFTNADQSTEQAVEEALREIKKDVMQQKIAEHMMSDANFCRDVWKSMHPQLHTLRSGELAKVEQQQQLHAECDQLQAEIDRLEVLKHSGRLTEEVSDLVAARRTSGAVESGQSSRQVV